MANTVANKSLGGQLDKGNVSKYINGLTANNYIDEDDDDDDTDMENEDYKRDK